MNQRPDWETMRDAAAILRREHGGRSAARRCARLARQLEERGTTCGGYRLSCIPWESNGRSGIFHNPRCPMSWEYRP